MPRNDLCQRFLRKDPDLWSDATLGEHDTWRVEGLVHNPSGEFTLASINLGSLFRWDGAFPIKTVEAGRSQWMWILRGGSKNLA